MADPNQVLVANLIEALQHLQRFIVIGLGASVSALALTSKTTAQDRVTVPGTSVAVVPDVARFILLAICILVGAKASYAAGSANTIAERLQSAPALLSAACTFPSVATSTYTGVHVLVALLPFIFAMIAIVRTALPYGAVGRKSIPGWLIFMAAAYVPLSLALISSRCLAK